VEEGTVTHVQTLPMTNEPLNPGSFVDLALEVAPNDAMSLVVAALDDSGISASDLIVVGDLPDRPDERATVLEYLAVWFRNTAPRPWRYLAHAIVEPTGDGGLAALALIGSDDHPPGRVDPSRR
jgi:hypothetical protein